MTEQQNRAEHSPGQMYSKQQSIYSSALLKSMATLGHVSLANTVINTLVQMTELHDLRLNINRQDLSSTLQINVPLENKLSSFS